MLIFAPAFGLQTLMLSETSSGNGTFSVVPKPCFQLYTLMAELNNTLYPCLFAFLPNKEAFTYKVILAVAKREDRKREICILIRWWLT